MTREQRESLQSDLQARMVEASVALHPGLSPPEPQSGEPAPAAAKGSGGPAAEPQEAAERPEEAARKPHAQPVKVGASDAAANVPSVEHPVKVRA